VWSPRPSDEFRLGIGGITPEVQACMRSRDLLGVGWRWDRRRAALAPPFGSSEQLARYECLERKTRRECGYPNTHAIICISGALP
jgi:hypothetical protein